MRVFLLKTCDTCRRALRELRQAGHDPAVVELREEGIPAADLARFLDAFGAELVNRRSTTWRQLSEAERARPPLELLTRHPTVMKRPVIEANGQLFLGWNADTRRALLG